MRRALFILATLALTAPSQAFARGEFDPTHEFELDPWVEIHLGPIDMSINKAVVYLMLGSVVTMALGIFLMRARIGVKPGHAPDDRRADLRGRADAGRRAGPAVEGDRPLVPLRGEPAAVHLRRQPPRLHPAAAHRRDVARFPGLGHLRRHLVALGDARPRAHDLRASPTSRASAGTAPCATSRAGSRRLRRAC